MLHNYLTIAIRNLLRQRTFSLINVLGLAVGLAACLLISLYVWDEWHFDRFHQEAHRIVLLQQFEGNSACGTAFAPALKSKVAQVEETARLLPHKALLSKEGSTSIAYYESNFYFADPAIFRILTLPLVEGDAQTALSTPFGLVISQRMARKYFAGENPLGKELRFANQRGLRITGVMKDLPSNSHVAIDFLSSFSATPTLLGLTTETYWDNPALTYVLLSEGATPVQLSAQLPAFARSTGDPNAGVWKLAAIPLPDLYLKYQLDGRVKAQHAIENVYIFGAVALFVLILACFNYVNLSSARSAGRAREVGVRKVLGASRSQLFRQFLGETFLYTLVSAVLALGIAQWALPSFNALAQKSLSLDLLLHPVSLAALSVGLLFLSLLAGWYPALILTSFIPSEMLKSGINRGPTQAWFRKTLVTTQFVVSMGMIVATLVVARQVEYVRTKDLGYSREQVLTLTLQGDVSQREKELLQAKMNELSAVQSVTLCSSLPGTGAPGQEKLLEAYVPAGSDKGGIAHLYADAAFVPTFGIQIREGRNFRPEDAGKPVFLINRAAKQFFGWQEAVGQTLGYYTWQYQSDGSYRAVPLKGEVIGVIEDYHQADLKSLITPLLISPNVGWSNQLAIKLKPGTLSTTLVYVAHEWKSLFPDKPFEYSFLDETFSQTYHNDQRTGRVFGVFAGLAVGIACLGLFGLTTYSAERRTKEIGIRKVLGASVTNIVLLLSKDFLPLILLANFIAWPVAWYLMDRWLQHFAYRIELNGWLFLAAGTGVLLLALITVSFQATKAALANPVKSLRME